MRRVSIGDVANLAGVSISTVSRVINNTGYPVSEKAKRQVQKAIEKLDYVPNISAQTLRENFNNIIGLLTRDISDPFFGITAKAVTERANSNGVLAFVSNTGRNPKNELKYHDMLWQHKVRGVILAGGAYDNDYKDKILKQLERYNSNGTKVVALAPQGFDMQYVMIDNRLAGEVITDYLIKNGHKKIAFVNGLKTHYTALARLDGYKISLKKHGLMFDESLVVYNEFSWEGGYEAAKMLLSRNIPFTSMCCANDNIAMGAIHFMEKSGIIIPNHISVISIGDIPMAARSTPALTTLQIPFYDMGIRAVDIILSNAQPDNKTDLIYKTKIIERDSVRKLV